LLIPVRNSPRRIPPSESFKALGWEFSLDTSEFSDVQVSSQHVSPAMHVSQLLGAAALLMAPLATTAPAMAASSLATPAADAVIRDVAPPSVWEERFLRQMPSAPNGLRQLASAATGQASWYGPGFYGNRTANGEVFRPGTYTAAQRSLPFGTRVKVTNLNNGRSTVVRINDRGPFVGGRIIDLAHGAASDLGVTASGVATVRLEVMP
jgi:rare lipoprotein A